MANYPYITYFLKEQLDEYIHQGPVGHRSVPQADKLTECLFCLCPDTETEVVLAHVFDDDDDADPDGSSFKKARSRLDGYKMI